MSSQNFSYDEFTKFRSVPRETYSRLEDYVALLKKWQKTINLIGDMTIPDIWRRHIIDSAQIFNFIPSGSPVVDLGSGAGFPGLVLGILGVKNMTLVESDKRKAAFLKEAARVTKTDAAIQQARVESISIEEKSVITARAFAPLKSIFEMLRNTLNQAHSILLLKGNNYMAEVEAAREQWNFEHEVFPSVTQQGSVVLLVRNITQRG